MTSSENLDLKPIMRIAGTGLGDDAKLVDVEGGWPIGKGGDRRSATSAQPVEVKPQRAIAIEERSIIADSSRAIHENSGR